MTRHARHPRFEQSLLCRLRNVTTAALALGLLLGAGPGHTAPTASAKPRPNILLITVDTLRADHLGAYGYPLPTSPHIDRLAAEGLLFTDAITPVPTTAPALASLLTGHHADGHGVRENFGELPATMTTLPEMLREAGYATAAFYGNGAIQNGFGQGFDVFEAFADHWFFRDEAGTTKALAWLEKAAEPWFLWVHFMDPHGPYNSSPAAYSRNFAYPDEPRLARRLVPAEQNYGMGVLPKYQQLPKHTKVGDYVRRYDGEIAGTDKEIGLLYDSLASRNQLDRTLIVLTADHGESLGENEYFFQHGTLLNEPSVRIPLLMIHPSLPRGTQTKTPASLIDLLPTLAVFAGIPAPPEALGRNLRAGDTKGKEDEITRLGYTVTPTRLTSVRRGRWELRGSPRRGGQPDDFERIELFDTRTSPPTLVAADQERGVRESLLPVLADAARQVRRPSGVARVPSPEEQKKLRALGYID